MKDLMGKVQNILATQFPGASVKLEKAGPDKVAGFLVWTRFKGVEQITRQSRLWTVLEKELTAEELLRVSTILTLTPEEMPVSQLANRLPRHGKTPARRVRPEGR